MSHSQCLKNDFGINKEQLDAKRKKKKWGGGRWGGGYSAEKVKYTKYQEKIYKEVKRKQWEEWAGEQE